VKIELNPVFKCLASSGDIAAAGTRGGSIVFWDASLGRERAACRIGNPSIGSIVSTSDSTWLAADQSGTLHLIEESGVLRSVSGEPVHFMALSAEPKGLLTAHSELILRDVQTLDVLKRGPALSGRIRSAACSPVGTTFAVADRSLLLWRPEEGDVERRDLSCAFVDFIDHAHLVVANAEWVDVYDLSGWTRRRSMRCFDGNVTCGWLDRAAQTAYVGTDRGFVVPFDLSTGQPRRPAALGSSPILALAPIRDGLVALQERAAHVLSRRLLETRGALSRHAESADLADFHPHKELLVSSDAHSIRLWNSRTGVQINAVQEERPINAVSTTISPDGSLVAFATYGSTSLHVFDVASARETTIDARALVYQLRFAPTHRALGLLSTYDAIVLISMTDHKQTILPGQYRAFTFSHPTGMVAGIAVDNTLRIFDYTGRNSLFQQRLDGEIARVEFGAGEDCVGLLDFSSNIRTVNLDTGREVCRIACPDPTDDVRFAVGDEGKLVAAGSNRGCVQLYYEGQKIAEFKLEYELRRLSIHDGKLWCACIESVGPDNQSTCFAEAASFSVAYDALFAYKLSL
jgi:WD40 repeat protein